MKIIDFIKIKYWDYKNPQPDRPEGLKCFVGLPGMGKTISMVELLEQTPRLYPDLDVKIFTNFGYAKESGNIKSMEDIEKTPANSIIAIDEVSKLFSCRTWQKFPPSMLSVVAQRRKMSKQILFTAQRFDHIDKVLRDLTNEIVLCNCIAKRWVFQNAIDPLMVKEVIRRDKEENEIAREFVVNNILWKYSFIITNELGALYDTNRLVDNLMQGMVLNEAKS